MCVVSMVGDHYSQKFNNPPYIIQTSNTGMPSFISRAEFEQLKRDVEEMKLLLLRAKEYDIKNNEPNCEMEDKVKLLKQVADIVGVDLEEIFGNTKK